VWETSSVERLYGGQNEMTVAKRLTQKYASRATEWQAGKIDLVTIQAWTEKHYPFLSTPAIDTPAKHHYTHAHACACG
jgi:hypothetical protein